MGGRGWIDYFEGGFGTVFEERAVVAMFGLKSV